MKKTTSYIIILFVMAYVIGLVVYWMGALQEERHNPIYSTSSPQPTVLPSTSTSWELPTLLHPNATVATPQSAPRTANPAPRTPQSDLPTYSGRSMQSYGGGMENGSGLTTAPQVRIRYSVENDAPMYHSPIIAQNNRVLAPHVAAPTQADVASRAASGPRKSGGIQATWDEWWNNYTSDKGVTDDSKFDEWWGEQWGNPNHNPGGLKDSVYDHFFGAPISDGIPCLLLLAVAYIIYRKRKTIKTL